jgi:Right handed beta helix region
VRDLICKLNIIENCGAGIVMGDDAEASAVSIENNHIRDIRGTGVLAAAGLAVGIGVARAAAATVAGNQIRRVAVAAANSRFVAGIFMLGVERSRIHGNEVSEIGPRGDFGGIGAGILVATPYAECDVARNQVERDAEPQANAGESAWAALLIADAGIFATTNLAGTNAGATTVAPGAASAAGAAINRTANTTTVRVDDRRTLVISGNRASISTARNDFIGTIAGTAATAVQGGAASVQGNTFAARGRAPAVFVVASAEALFSDNRCIHQGTRGLPAVVLSTPVALLNANRVRSGDVSIAVLGSRTFTALGNITTGVVRVNNNPLAAPWAALNVIG